MKTELKFEPKLIQRFKQLQAAFDLHVWDMQHFPSEPNLNAAYAAEARAEQALEKLDGKYYHEYATSQFRAACRRLAFAIRQSEAS